MFATWAAFCQLLPGWWFRLNGQGHVACLQNDQVGFVGPVHGTLRMDASLRVGRLAAHRADSSNRSDDLWLRVIHGRTAAAHGARCGPAKRDFRQPRFTLRALVGNANE